VSTGCDAPRRCAIGIAVIGFDIGTSSTKGALVDDEGSIRATATRDHALRLPAPGTVEADAELVWGAFVEVARSLTRRARRDGLSIRALATSASVDESVFVDTAGRPVGPVIMAPDTRVSPAFGDWVRDIGPDRIYAITGLPIYPAYALPRIIGLRGRRPRQFDRVVRVLDWAAFVSSRLGLPPATDPSIAARTMAWDVRAGAWSLELLDAAGVSPDVFPGVVPTGSAVGEVPSGAGRPLGIPGGAVLVSGGMDQWLAALGSGVTAPGQAMVGTGTWEALVVPLASFPASLEPLRTTGISVGPFLSVHEYAGLATQIGGGSFLRWFRGVFAPGRSFSSILRSAPDRPTGLLVLPHAEGSFSPWMDPESRVAIAGVGLETGKGELLRGVMEGITFELRENIARFERAGIRVGRLYASGGGARSSAWLQLKADVLDRPVAAVDIPESAAFGAALMAGAAIGLFGDSADVARSHVQTTRVFEPRPTFARAYDAIYERYRQLYPALRVVRATRNPRQTGRSVAG
jgi:xylulokinase